MTNPVTIEIDIAGVTPVEMALATISEYDGVLKNFIAVGLAGGNPELTIEFPNVSLARSYLFDVGVSPDEMDLYIDHGEHM